MKNLITNNIAASTLNNLHSNRELFYFFCWRDIKVRYKQTFVGIAWVILQPFLSMVVFSFIFGSISGFSSGNIPYPLFVFSGLIYWNLFSRSLSSASECIIVNQNLIKKIYLSKIIILLASVIVNLVDFFFAFLFLLFLNLYYHYQLPLGAILFTPVALLILLLLAIGGGAVLAVWNVYYRDVRFIIPYMLQIFLFLTPVVYSLDKINNTYKSLLLLNPLTGVMSGVRSLFFGVEQFNYQIIFISIIFSLIIFFTGIFYFQSQEKKFAEVV